MHSSRGSIDAKNWLVIALLAWWPLLGLTGCPAAPVDHRPRENANANLAPAAADEFDGNVAGRRDAHLQPLSRQEYDSFTAAVAALQRGEPEECVSLLGPLVAAGRDDEWILNNHGTGLLAAGQAREALEVLYRGLQLYPDNGYLHLNTARALDALDDGGGAIPHYQAYLDSELTDRQPQKTLQAMVALAEDLAAEGRVDDAGKLLEQGADRFPGLPVFDELMAAVAWTRGDQEQFAELANAAATRFDAIDPPTGPTGPNGLTASGAYAWPLRGAATIRRGPGQKPGHLGVRRRFSLQLLPLGDDLQPRPENVPMLGSDVHAWVGFGAEVLAARDGVVLRVVDRWPDQTHTGVTESDPTPTNCVVLRHDDGELSEYRCLQARSLQVKPGDRVTVGQVLARVGCSGPRPMVPHLEFRVARQTDDGMNPGLAFTFHPIQQFDAAAGKWVPVEGETVPANDLPLRAIAGD